MGQLSISMDHGFHSCGTSKQMVYLHISTNSSSVCWRQQTQKLQSFSMKCSTSEPLGWFAKFEITILLGG